MKHRIFRSVLAVAALALTAAAPKAFSYAYNPWTGSTGAMKLAINPFFYASQFSPTFAPAVDAVVAYGITPSLDVIANLATVNFSSTGAAYGGSWVMPRYDFGGNNIVGLQLKYTPGSTFTFDVVPQYHFFWENDYFAAEANAYIDVAIQNATVAVPFIKTGFYLAPVVKIIKDLFYFYCEIDPTFTSAISTAYQSKFELGIVPGITILLGGATHQISIGVPLGSVLTVSTTVQGAITPGINIWYWTAIDFGGGKK